MIVLRASGISLVVFLPSAADIGKEMSCIMISDDQIDEFNYVVG